jgi:hypothetical protein
VVGGSANGDRLPSLGSIGEYTVVASTKRGVLGTLSDDADEQLDEARSRDKGVGRFFSLSADPSCQQPM